MLPENWNKMTADQKLNARLTGWAGTEGKPFATPEAANCYSERAQRLIAALKLQKLDRVPRVLLTGDYPGHYAGVSQGELFYDYDKMVFALNKFHEDFDLDYSVICNAFPGKVYDRLGYKLYRLPGNQLSATQSFQFVEGEYMRADEYDALIANPEGWLMRTYNPRVLPSLAGLSLMPGMLGTTEIPFVPFMMVNFSIPPLQEALKAMSDAAMLTLEWLGANGQAGAVSMGKLGLPATIGGFSKAPFDFLGDSLRGTRGIMMDLFRYPNKVLAAVERLVPLAIDMGVGAATGSGNPFVLIPLHKGADGFMSTADFEKFYWPSFKQVLLGLINEGVVPFMFVEGSYNHRLDVIANSGLPAGKTMWLFDQTDMAEAKKKFGSWACIGGNVPASLFKAGTPAQMEAYVKKVIDTCAPDGGYFICPGAVLDQAQDENVCTYLKVAKEYGKS
ncbi:MAG: uroporphyrinogen decarboxylase [Chloroflexi bacterium]|nr:uroporphyrinogen decarboxylase [Chloroflexota bacterium]